MLDVTSFLMRWLYLCNLVRDRAEIQSLPYTPLSHQHYHPAHHPLPYPPPPMNQPPISPDASTGHFELTSPTGTLPHATPLPHLKNIEEDWRDQCLRGLLSYPPGTQRLLAMDALRVELVQKLSQQLRISDDTLRQFAAACRKQNERALSAPLSDDDDDPYLDADAEIVRAFGQATMTEDDIVNELDEDKGEEEEAALVISRNGTDLVQSAHDEAQLHKNPVENEPELEDETMSTLPSSQEVEEAHRMVLELREYLPQLVSAVLHSPAALTKVQGLDPIQKLRQLILTRCLQDPSWGINLCWLLEAEVGRAWKTLFEHRQQTGKRLIVVLPAERAAALAKIGMEKRGAFNLLQDAEQATAYGYMLPSMDPLAVVDRDMVPAPPRLPSSLSMRRCSHFGDTMHFIDRLTQISLDLREVSNLQRQAYLEHALAETNRRVRRRMITRGDVSLDVEDNRGPYDWPDTSDLTVDMLEYSVHFPLEPMSGMWPSGDDEEDSESAGGRARRGAMRVLNIVASESRILASRERCPFLVHLEVAETGLDGSDARLYASGSRNLGTTIEEALGLGAAAAAAGAASRRNHYGGGFPGCRIPPELLARPVAEKSRSSKVLAAAAKVIDADRSHIQPESSSANGPYPHGDGGNDVPRGGWQTDEGAFYPSESAEYLYSNPHDMVRQQEYEQLHQQMRFQQRPAPIPEDLPLSTAQRPTLSTKSALLEKVYGLPWEEKCNQIRQTSPFGNVDGWRLATFIMKAGEDIRREALVMQVIGKLNDWFQTDLPESHRPYLRPYRIMCVGGDAGLLECVNDAKSVDEVKKQTDGFTSLREYFERAYGPPTRIVRQAELQRQGGGPSRGHHATNASAQNRPQATEISFEKAQDNFLRSLVGYSLVCFILQIKDRHNANILLDREGHVIHIDFGFVLGDTPKMGKVPIFSERAPFKLSTEFWEVLGGWNFHEGGLGVRFCKMFEAAFACAVAHADEIVSLVEAAVLNLTRDPDEARSIANHVRARLSMRGPADSVEQKSFIMELVNSALTSWGTSTYDWLQKSLNGYE